MSRVTDQLTHKMTEKLSFKASNLKLLLHFLSNFISYPTSHRKTKINLTMQTLVKFVFEQAFMFIVKLSTQHRQNNSSPVHEKKHALSATPKAYAKFRRSNRRNPNLSPREDCLRWRNTARSFTVIEISILMQSGETERALRRMHYVCEVYNLIWVFVSSDIVPQLYIPVIGAHKIDHGESNMPIYDSSFVEISPGSFEN
ncbi:hypothetical protein TNCT_398391 [Trichonephila clavata]|uniref:Uncharacterized protein n=1 Tax=Trichonephila clavata TaxID=2740835 RepID=A0A8X6JFS8_TRICU|nr:hypothetical protein TNCT_398391 [Trichonephila clavata]